MSRVEITPADGAQRARISLRFGRAVQLDGDVTYTSTGLLAVGGLVSAILLSTAVLVGVAAGSARRIERQ